MAPQCESGQSLRLPINTAKKILHSRPQSSITLLLHLPSLLPSPNAVALSCLPFSQSVIYSRLLSIQGWSLASRGCENLQPNMRITATYEDDFFAKPCALRSFPSVSFSATFAKVLFLLLSSWSQNKDAPNTRNSMKSDMHLNFHAGKRYIN